MLKAPGDPDDGYEKCKSENNMKHGYPESGDKEPDNIQEGEQAARHIAFIHFKCAAERPET